MCRFGLCVQFALIYIHVLEARRLVLVVQLLGREGTDGSPVYMRYGAGTTVAGLMMRLAVMARQKGAGSGLMPGDLQVQDVSRRRLRPGQLVTNVLKETESPVLRWGVWLRGGMPGGSGSNRSRFSSPSSSSSESSSSSDSEDEMDQSQTGGVSYSQVVASEVLRAAYLVGERARHIAERAASIMATMESHQNDAGRFRKLEAWASADEVRKVLDLRTFP